MDNKTLKQIEKKLLGQKKELESRLSDVAKKDKNKPDNFLARFPDYGNKDDENAAEVAVFSDRLSLEHQSELELRDIGKALDNIKKETYGICKYCHKPIDAKRLLARPTSSSCASCKRRLKGEK